MVSQVLQAVDIHKTYKKVRALDGVNFDLKKGEIHSLLGPNGAGKTTLIKIMATLLTKDSGSVNILGFDLDKDEQHVRHILGYCGQDTERSAYARLTPLENLRFFGSLRGLTKDEIDDKVYRFSDYMEFNGNLDKQFMHLSGGQKQAVIIMRSLLHDPPIIFLDEPTKGLDPIIAKKIRRFLVEYTQNEGKSLLLTSHILTEVDEVSNRVSLIHKGKISITGTPTELKTQVGAKDFIELNLADLPDATRERLTVLDQVLTTSEKEGGWLSLGLNDLFEGTEAIIQVLRSDNIKAGFRQHSVTLEDAFIHHIGVLDESFDN
ncbi:MAG: ABC transporter ATP-binding protein [Candidatus Kariarchaeaceae archaeon]|jgi:ABC-2 type transport system ATP-binding protein